MKIAITSGPQPGPQKVLIYGPEGIGKSTLAAMFPNPLFIDVEGSTKHLNVRRLPVPENWTQLLELVRFVILNSAECDTLVIDTADWAEALCAHHVCAKNGVSGIEDFGYGKGYTYLAEEFANLLGLLTECVEAGVNVVILAHAAITKFEQPDELAAYDRWVLKLRKQTSPMLKEWADAVLFANYKTYIVKDSKTQAKRGEGGKRVIFTEHRPAWDAKNRHGLPSEIVIEGVKELPAELAAMLCTRIDEPTPFDEPAAPAPKPEPVAESSADESVAALEAEAVSLDYGREDLNRLGVLMVNHGITDEQVRQFVAAEGYYPQATPLTKYAENFVTEGLIPGFAKIVDHFKTQAELPLA